MAEGFDLRKQRTLLNVSLYSIAAIFIYVYIFNVIIFFVGIVFLWYMHDFVREFTKEKVDPTGKYVFITGCDTGFGLDSAKAIRDLGFDVIAGCYDDKSPGALELRQRPWVKKVEVVGLDVTNEASVLACVKEVKDICQDQGLWAVINNAGINSQGPTELVSMEMYHRVAEINLFGAVRVTKAVLPLIRQAQGRIINVTSERAFNPWKDNSPYCISKFGLEAFSACLRREMEKFKVKVITVAPGQFAAATSIIVQKKNEEMMDKLLHAHANLSIQDQQKAYSKEDVLAMSQELKEAIHKSCPTGEPVVQAYIDAVQDVDPQRCYMVHGLKRKCMDPHIIMCRCRPYIPERVVEYVEKLVFGILG